MVRLKEKVRMSNSHAQIKLMRIPFFLKRASGRSPHSMHSSQPLTPGLESRCKKRRFLFLWASSDFKRVINSIYRTIETPAISGASIQRQ